jgi:UDP-galactopyranose mutase
MQSGAFVIAMIPILGAGLSGLSAARNLKRDHIILEREARVGGLCKSVDIHGYIFDYAPHILFTRDDHIRDLFKEQLKGNLLRHTREAFIFLRGAFARYPFEVNLHNLPEDVIKECIDGVVDREVVEATNFEEWIYSTFGDGIAKHYMVPYNRKIWKYDLAKMNINWIAGRVPSPSVEEIKEGAARSIRRDIGPNADFMYPMHGGIGALANQLSKGLNVSTDSEVVEIRPSRDKVIVNYTKDEESREFSAEKVLSSIPLPDLVEMLHDPPIDVVKAAESLVYNSLVCVNIGIRRPEIIDKHWLYFPEDDLIFNRMSFPMNFSEYTTPGDASSILVEVTHREDSVDIEAIQDQVLEDLEKTGIIEEDEVIDVCDTSAFKYAYVIYDLDHEKNVGIIHDYLESVNVVPIGRFGEWEYFNMDKALLSGANAASRISGA